MAEDRGSEQTPTGDKANDFLKSLRKDPKNNEYDPGEGVKIFTLLDQVTRKTQEIGKTSPESGQWVDIKDGLKVADPFHNDDYFIEYDARSIGGLQGIGSGKVQIGFTSPPQELFESRNVNDVQEYSVVIDSNTDREAAHRLVEMIGNAEISEDDIWSAYTVRNDGTIEKELTVPKNVEDPRFSISQDEHKIVPLVTRPEDYELLGFMLSGLRRELNAYSS